MKPKTNTAPTYTGTNRNSRKSDGGSAGARKLVRVLASATSIPTQ